MADDVFQTTGATGKLEIHRNITPLRVVFAVGAVVVAGFVEQSFGVVKAVGSGPAAVDVRWWQPFGFAGSVFVGLPATGSDESVVSTARGGQVVDSGVAAVGVGDDMVDVAKVAGYVAAGMAAAAVARKTL